MLEELRKLGDLYKQPIVFCTSKDIQPHGPFWVRRIDNDKPVAQITSPSPLFFSNSAQEKRCRVPMQVEVHKPATGRYILRAQRAQQGRFPCSRLSQNRDVLFASRLRKHYALFIQLTVQNLRTEIQRIVYSRPPPVGGGFMEFLNEIVVIVHKAEV